MILSNPFRFEVKATKVGLTGMKGIKGMGKISAECKVQGAEKKTVQIPKPIAFYPLPIACSSSPLPICFYPLHPLHPC